MRINERARASRPAMAKLALSLVTSLALMLSASTATLAGPFETANAYYGAKYHVPDFKFTKAEFGNTPWGQVIHLGKDAFIEHFKGATVVYNPAKNEVRVYVNSGSAFNGRIIFATSKCQLLSGKTALGNPGPDGICLPADTLVGNNGGPSLSSVTPAQARSCTFDAGKDGKDVHSC